MRRNYIIYLFIALIALFLSSGKVNSQTPVHLNSITDNLQSPIRVAIDKNDNLFVIDNHQEIILKYDISGNLLGTINPDLTPISLAIDRDNQLFVGDAHSGNIYKLDNSGIPSLFFSGIAYPSSMVFCNDSNLYVVDSKYNQITVLNPAGNIVRSFGSGIFTYPSGIAFDNKNNRILVSEHGGIGDGFNPIEKIWLFTLEGSLIGSFGSHGNTNGKFYRIQGMAVGRCGNIYVPDPFLGWVSVFNENRVFLTKFGYWGESLGNLNVPMDIVIDSQDRIFITSMNNGALEVFNISDTLPTSKINSFTKNICFGSTADIPVYFTGAAPWSFTYTVDGINPVTINNVTGNPYILTVSDPGVYQVSTVSDLNYTGTCKSGYAQIIVSNLSATANIPTANITLCEGQTGVIPVNFTGSAPWSFTYTQNGLSPKTITGIYSNHYDISTDESGQYEIIDVNGGGCTGTFSGNFTINYNLKPLATFTNGNGTVDICTGETAQIPVTLSGIAPFTLVYSRDEYIFDTIVNITSNSYNLQLDVTGTYEINAVSDANCSNLGFLDYKDVIVHPMQTANIISNDIEICSGDNADILIELSGTPPWNFTYTKDGNNPVLVSNIETSTYALNVNTAGLYELTSLSGSYCSEYSLNGQANIIVKDRPTVSFAQTFVSVCAGDSTALPVELTGNFPWSFSYTINGTDTVIVSGISQNIYNLIPAIEGTYVLTFVNDAKCSGSILTSTSDYIIRELPAALMETLAHTICEGQSSDISIALTGTPPYNFSYIKNNTDTFHVYNAFENLIILSLYEQGTYKLLHASDIYCSGTGSGEYVLNISPLPVIDIGSDLQVCEGTNQTLDAGIFASYLWNDSSIEQIINIINTGNYSVTVTDSNGCQNSDEVSVFVTPAPEASISNGAISFCSGQSANISVNLTGTPPYSFTFLKDGTPHFNIINTNNSPYIISIYEPGTYSLMNVTSGSCAGLFSGMAVVTMNTLPLVDLGPEINQCFGEVYVADAGAFASYIWNDLSTNETLTVDTSGIYSVTVTDTNGCENSDVIAVNIAPELSAAIFSDNNNVCEGQSANISVNFTGIPPYNFVYTKDGFNPVTIANTDINPYIFSVNEAGTYVISQITNGICTGTTTGSVTININSLPVVDLGMDSEICYGTSQVLNPGIFETYLWNDQSSGQSLSVSSAGTYTLTVTDGNGCQNSDDFTLSVSPALTAIINTDNINICQGQSVELSVNFTGIGPYNFTYTRNGSDTVTISNTEVNPYVLTFFEAGLYEISQITNAGCTGSSGGSAMVNIDSLPLVNLGNDVTLCQGDSNVIDAGVFSTYLWNNQSNAQTLTVSLPGTYSVTVSDSNGCLNYDDILVSVIPIPVSSYTFSANNLEITFFNNSVDATSYLWDFGDGTTSTETSPVHIYSQPGVYTVILTSTEQNCSVFVSNVVDVTLTGINKAQEIFNFSVYPNPTKGNTTIRVDGTNGPVHIELINNIGQIVYSKNYNKAGLNTLELDAITSGIYYAKITAGKYISHIKLEIRK